MNIIKQMPPVSNRVIIFLFIQTGEKIYILFSTGSECVEDKSGFIKRPYEFFNTKPYENTFTIIYL